MISLDEIRLGLNRGEFFLEYLPTISLVDGRCVGAEALVRWRRPTGIVSPKDFIPLAENTPLSGLLTYWVIDTVALELRDWLRANPAAHISINVPPEILGRGGIEYAANKSGLFEIASQVILEITERGIPDVLGVKAINEHRGSGVRLALDDVTRVGGANLSVLARCDLQVIKLDMSLISQITPQCPTPEWLAGIAALIQTSRLEVVAEGVETEQQLTVLQAANIQAAQGYYFSRPLPVADFIVYHAASNEDDLGSAPDPAKA